MGRAVRRERPGGGRRGDGVTRLRRSRDGEPVPLPLITQAATRARGGERVRPEPPRLLRQALLGDDLLAGCPCRPLRAGDDRAPVHEDGAGAARALGRAAVLDRVQAEFVAEQLELDTVFVQEWKYLEQERRDRILAERRRYEERIRALFREGREHGDLRSDLDENVAALLFLSAANWAFTWLRAGADTDALADAFFALQPQFAAMRVNQALRDGETEAAWGTRVDGSYRFRYVSVTPARTEPRLSFDPPTR